MIENCKDICQIDCHSFVRLFDGERVEVEYQLSNGEGVADVAILPNHTEEPKVVLEVYFTHRTTSRHGLWLELDAKEVISAKYKANQRPMTPHEQREIMYLLIPTNRDCLSHLNTEWIHSAVSCSNFQKEAGG